MTKSFIWPIDSTLYGATTSCHNGTLNDDNEGVLYILQSFTMTGVTLSDFLMSY